MSHLHDSAAPAEAAPSEAPRFAEARSLKRELLEELRSGWEQGVPVQAEDLLPRWPGDPDADPDVASLLFEEYCQRKEHGEEPAREEYDQRFPAQKDSLANLFHHHALLRSIGGTDHEPGRASAASLALPGVGDEVFGFRLRQELGRGAFARVFLGEQIELADRPVVLKVSAIQGDEAQTLAQLQHTHIVPIHSVHEDPRAGLRGVCMPYFGGASLSSVLKVLWSESNRPTSGEQLLTALTQVAGPPPLVRGRREQAAPLLGQGLPTPPQQGGSRNLAPQEEATQCGLLMKMSYVRVSAWMVARLAEALQHAHERGVLHRDIKPSNVLLSADGQPMLLDFNLAQNLNENQAAEATLGGTVAYMSPEHLRALAARDPVLARQIDQRADIYSLGMVLYEMLAGHSPFDQSASYSPMPALIEAMAVERGRTAPSLRQHRQDVPWSLESIARKCLAPEREQRYQKAEHLAEDLRRFLEDRPLRYAPELSWRERAAKWVRRHPRLAYSGLVTAVASSLLIAVAVLLFWIWGEWKEAQKQADEAAEAAQKQADEAAELEARQRIQDFDGGHQRAVCLVNTTIGDLENVIQGLKVCEDTLGLDQRLPALDRKARAEEVRELLLLLAQARVYLATSEAKLDMARSLDVFLRPLTCTPSSGNPALFCAVSLLECEAKVARLCETILATHRRALELLDRAEALPGLKDSLALCEARALHLERLGKHAAASDVRKKAKELKPQGARDHYWLATSLAFRGRYAEAINHLQEALSQNPRHYWSLLQMGICHMEIGDATMALGDFNACIVLWPKVSWGYFNRGVVLHQLGRHKEAFADYSVALKRDEKSGESYFNRGLVALDMQKYEQALEDFNRAAALGFAGVRLHAGRGIALEHLGKSAEADAAFARAWKLDPHNIPMRLAYGFTIFRRLPDRAEEAFTEVLDRDPRNVRALYGLGMLRVHKNSSSRKGYELFTRALLLDPAFVEPRCARANILAHWGEWKQAREDIDWCLKMAPTGQTLYAGACVYALTAGAVGADKEQSQWFRKRALDLLREAFDRGYGQDRAKEDTDLASIHNEPVFLQLIENKK
jgi:serine/threonine protein kinase/tetratricopeptide (TPR) repeat protein